MERKKIPFLSLLLCLWLAAAAGAQQTKTSLPRGVPEAEGVSSAGILEFLEAAGKSKHEFHSLMVLRHGKVIAEGWWDPYRPDLRHTMYSVSKSFTSTAVGFAVSEKRLRVADKVLSFFSQEAPAGPGPQLAAMTVKDLLTMSAGQAPDPTAVAVTKDDWVKAFLATPVVNQPGTQFLYNSMATYMLSAIVQKVTGERVIDYLRPRLFDPLGIRGVDWEEDPSGVNTGGWGLRVRTEDMAKLGQLYLQKGNWRGKQILPREWVEEATTSSIDSAPAWVKPQTKRETSDWLQGYGYQFWRCRHNAFRADGAFGQFIIVMPDQDAVIVITAETSDMQDEINLIWEHLLPAMRGGTLPADKNASLALKRKLAALALPRPTAAADSPLAAGLAAKSFALEPNEIGIESMSLQFKNGVGRVTLKSGTQTHQLAFGANAWQAGETFRPTPSLIPNPKGKTTGRQPAKVAGSYRWKDDQTLELTLRYVETPHTEFITCRFDGNKIDVDLRNSLEKGSKKAKGES